MSAKKPSEQQKNLPFEEAQGTHDERRSHLGLALMRVECDLVMRELVMMIFNTTHGGAPGEVLFKTYGELARRPWGLCCSVSKVKTSVNLAVHAGLILAEERRYNTGSVAGLEYSINWPGINALLGFSVRRRRQAAGASGELTPALGELTPALGELHTKEITTSLKPVLKAGQVGGLEASEVSTAVGARVAGWDASARAYVETELAAVGFQRAKTLSREIEATGIPAAQVVAICDEYRANRGLLTGPGAIAYRLREGCWPADGVLPVAERHAIAARQADDARESAQRKLREQLEVDLSIDVRDARRQGLSIEQITSLVRSKYPHDFCDARGWPALQPPT